MASDVPIALGDKPRLSIAAQIASCTLPSLTDLTSAPRIHLNNREFILEEWVFTKSKRGRRSWIEQHGYFLMEVNSQGYIVMNSQGKKKQFWSCNYCDTKPSPAIYQSDSTTGASKHLNERYRYFNPEKPDERAIKRPRQSVFELIQQNTGKPIVMMNEADELKKLFVNWLIDAFVPFRCVRYESFQSLLRFLNSKIVDEVIPSSDTTIRRWVCEKFEEGKEDITKSLHTVLSKVHLSFDLWTSPNAYTLLRIVGHWFNNIGIL